MVSKVAFTLITIIVILACNSGNSNTANIDAERIYKVNCVICHGVDGKLGINGAKDLTTSPMTLEERINNITNGAGTMQAYKDILTEEEIKAVAKYTMTLEK